MDSFDEILTYLDRRVVVTYHPSAILRMPTYEAREEARAQLRHDLERAWTLTRGGR